MKNIILYISLLFCSVVNVVAQQYFPFEAGGEASDYDITKSEEKGLNYRDITYTFNGFYIENIEIDGKAYKNVLMPGIKNIEEKGDPALPYFTDVIDVESADITLEILNVEEKEYDGYDIAPSQGLVLQLSERDSVREFSEVYKKGEYYPGNHHAVLLDIQRQKGMYKADVNVYPIQYNPVAGTIRCCQSITYRVSWPEDTLPKPQRAPNPIDVDETGAKVVSRSRPVCDYIIVTTPQLRNSLGDFLAWKAMQGHKCHVISSNWKAGDEKIVRDSIINAYKANKYDETTPEYLLIVGDYGSVPGYLMDQPKGKYDYTKEYGQISSDLRYKCLDGDGSRDFSPELAAGRIPVSNEEEARNVFQKIIRYEKEPTENEAFYNHAVHCAQFEKEEGTTDKESSLLFMTTSETLRQKILCFGKNVDVVYSTGETGVTPRYFTSGALLPEDIRWPSPVWNGNTNDIINHINNGCYYIFHRDHGNIECWGTPTFCVSDMNRLTNKDLYPIVFSINCLTGSYQSPYISPDKTPCFTSKILSMKDAGAVGVVAASGLSYSGVNDDFIISIMNHLYVTPSKKKKDKSLLDLGLSIATGSIFGTVSSIGSLLSSSEKEVTPVYEMGKLLNVAGEDALNNYGKQIFHYFGDPSMQMYTEAPACFEKPTIVQNGTTVSVKMNGVENCNIAISSYLDHGQSFVNVAEGVSSVTFRNIDFPYTIVISKHNYKPFIIDSRSFDQYVQNETIKEDVVEMGRNISLGKSVTTTLTVGDVVVEAGSKLDLKATKRIYFSKGFKTDGGKMYATIMRGSDDLDYICNFSYRDPVSVYDESLRSTNLVNVDNPDVDPYDNPILTGNEDKLGGADFVYGGHQTIVVQMGQPTDIEVYNVVGQLLGSYQGVSQATYDFEPGVYLVKYSGKVAKVQVLR